MLQICSVDSLSDKELGKRIFYQGAPALYVDDRLGWADTGIVRHDGFREGNGVARVIGEGWQR
jgi:hypothetical protein